MKKKIYWIVLIALTICVSHAKNQPLPDDVKALVQRPSTSNHWNRYHAIPSLRIGQKTPATADIIDQKSTNCPKIIAYFEKKYGIPEKLMLAIARVESRCRPWAVHHNGASHQFRHVTKALNFLETATGNIQIGCMQLDIRSHGRRFRTTEMMMTPYYNIEFAAKLLRRLYKRYGSWERAVSFYHAASPTAQKAYCRKITKQLDLLRGNKLPKSGDSWI